MLKCLHTADLHFSNKPEKLAEVITVTDFIIEQARTIQPGLIIIAGDSCDEYDGAIRIDSDCARAAIRFVLACADIAPVAIVRGTPSHDRRTPEIFRELRGRHQIHVASQIEVIGLSNDGIFYPYGLPREAPQYDNLAAVLSFIPSPDKAHVIAAFGGESKQLTTLAAKEALHDVLTYIGTVNEQVPAGVPRILIGHGMVAGSEFSSGTTSTGEDLEFSVSDLMLTNTEIKCLGHIHKQQNFPGDIYYSGSPGRLNYGETEDKGFLVATVKRDERIKFIEFIKTPAREFYFVDVEWESVQKLEDALSKCLAECSGKDTRFRYTIPEEDKASFPRERVVAALESAGARNIKCEWTIIPKERIRVAEIVNEDTLEGKLMLWGKAKETTIPERSLEIIRGIEGNTSEELLAFARQRLCEPEYRRAVNE